MRSRLRFQNNLSLSSMRTARALAALALFSPVLSGCDGHSSSTSASQGGPIVAAAVPAGGTNPTFTVAAATPPQTGSTVTVRVEIANSSSLNATTDPPRLDVLGPAGTSLTNGPQPMQSLSSDPNGWVYQYNITTGVPRQVYAFVVYAQSASGNTGNTPFNLGVQTLPPQTL